MQTPLITSLNLIIIFVLPFLNVDIPKITKLSINYTIKSVKLFTVFHGFRVKSIHYPPKNIKCFFKRKKFKNKKGSNFFLLLVLSFLFFSQTKIKIKINKGQELRGTFVLLLSCLLLPGINK